jgi:hypothetical protein
MRTTVSVIAAMQVMVSLVVALTNVIPMNFTHVIPTLFAMKPYPRLHALVILDGVVMVKYVLTIMNVK